MVFRLSLTIHSTAPPPGVLPGVKTIEIDVTSVFTSMAFTLKKDGSSTVWNDIFIQGALVGNNELQLCEFEAGNLDGNWENNVVFLDRDPEYPSIGYKRTGDDADFNLPKDGYTRVARLLKIEAQGGSLEEAVKVYGEWLKRQREIEKLEDKMDDCSLNIY